nr:MAG: hypothetical protein [Apis rhabdovirus 5]
MSNINLIVYILTSLLLSNVSSTIPSPSLRGNYQQVFNITYSIPVPPEPVCDILASGDDRSTSHGIISIWSYESSPKEDQYDFLITKHEVTTSCTVYFFGAEEKSIVSTKQQFIPDSDLSSEPLISFIKEIQSGIFVPMLMSPVFECSWTGTREVTTYIYKIQRIRIKFSPDGKIVYPFYKQWSGQKTLLQNGELLVLGKYTHFDLCDLKLQGLYPGIVSHGAKGLTVSIPTKKEFFYVFSNTSSVCNNITVLLTSGGYLISILDNECKVDHAYLDTLGKKTNLRYSRAAQYFPQDHMGNYNKTIPRLGKRMMNITSFRGFDELWENYYNVNSTAYHVPVSINMNVISMNSKRSQRSVKSTTLVLSNYQLTFSRSELQWGLNHLANLTKINLLRHHLDICLIKQNQWKIAMSLISYDPTVMASLIMQVNVPFASLKGNLLYINKTVMLDNIIISDPLICQGRYCKLSHPDDLWLESSTGVILSNPQNSGLTSSFIVEISEKKYLDIITNKIIHSMVSLHPLVWGDTWDYSFNSSMLEKQHFLYNTGQLLQSSTFHPIIKREMNLGNISGAVGAWFKSLGTWFWDTLVYIILLLFVLYIVVFLLKQILRYHNYQTPATQMSWFNGQHTET